MLVSTGQGLLKCQYSFVNPHDMTLFNYTIILALYSIVYVWKLHTYSIQWMDCEQLGLPLNSIIMTLSTLLGYNVSPRNIVFDY